MGSRIQVSMRPASSGSTGIALGGLAPTSAFVRREEREEGVGRLAFLDLGTGRPVGPDAGEAGAGAGISQPNQMSHLRSVELAKRVERHHATVSTPQPMGPVFALHVADVVVPPVRSILSQFIEVDGLALGLQIFGSFFGGVISTPLMTMACPPTALVGVRFPQPR